jgi:AbiU2
MSSHQSAEQAHQQAIDAMGSSLGDLYNALSDELTLRFWRWQQFTALYATKPERLELMNRAAPYFFWIAQAMFWDDALLGIARLTGPARTAGHDNLSFERLPSLVPNVLASTVTDLVDTLKGRAAFAIEWRNRRIAHHDLALALNRSAAPLPPASREKVDTAHQAMASVLNAVSKHFMDTTTAYHWDVSVHGAESLLFVVRDGLRRQELRQEQLERGEYHDEDWDTTRSAV